MSKQLHQHSKSIPLSSRLQSISRDAGLLRDFAQSTKLPVIANERCGSWYVPPELKAGSAYFKSTDGHVGEWSFSLRRLNLQVLKLIGTHGGCILVDSCRRGKHMSDALSKTLPIWCCVLNRLLFPEDTTFHDLHLDRRYVCESEEIRIKERLDAFLAAVKSLELDTEGLRASLEKPVFSCCCGPDPAGAVDVEPPASAKYHIVWAYRASLVEDGNTAATLPGYVQGAGDDAETWARGMTSEIFWSVKDILLATSEEQLAQKLDECVINFRSKQTAKNRLTSLVPSGQLTLGDASVLGLLTAKQYTLIVLCGPSIDAEAYSWLSKALVHLKCRAGKLGARDLRQQLYHLTAALSTHRLDKILVCGSEGQDIALGVALAIICKHADEDMIHNQAQAGSIDKSYVKRKLALMTSVLPTACESDTNREL